MSKPRLLVLQGERNFEVPTYAESFYVADCFDIVKHDQIVDGTDLVYTQAYGGFYKELQEWGGPYVVHMGGNPWLELRGQRLANAKDMLERAKLVTCVSKFLKREIETGLGKRHEHIVSLPGGLWGQDHTPLGPSVTRFVAKEKYGFDGRPLVIMSIALVNNLVKMRKWRGIPMWLSAVGRVLKNYKAHVLCMGRGDLDFPELREWGNLWGFEFVRSHHLDNSVDRWPEILRKADVFVHPGMYDCWPRVIAEAMIVGLPCFAYDVTGNSEVGNSVLLSAPNNRKKVADILDSLLYNQLPREELGERGRAEAIHKTYEHRADLASLLIKTLEE